MSCKCGRWIEYRDRLMYSAKNSYIFWCGFGSSKKNDASQAPQQWIQVFTTDILYCIITVFTNQKLLKKAGLWIRVELKCWLRIQYVSSIRIRLRIQLQSWSLIQSKTELSKTIKVKSRFSYGSGSKLKQNFRGQFFSEIFWNRNLKSKIFFIKICKK
jgi:hypothetical protein